MSHVLESDSDDEQSTPVIHFPGGGGTGGSHKRAGSTYTRPGAVLNILQGDGFPRNDGPARGVYVRPRSPVLKTKTRKRRKNEYRHGSKSSSSSSGNSSAVDARRRPVDHLTLARKASQNFRLLSQLSSGRIDPFNIYVERDLPVYIDNIFQHAILTACRVFVPSEKTADLEKVRMELMDEIHAPLAWFSIIMASISHHTFISGYEKVPERQQLLRLSYYSKTVSLINEELRREDIPSDVCLVGIATLIVHGGGALDRPFFHDKVQIRKAFGTANDMHYYSSIELDHSHWRMLARFVEHRGGPTAIKMKVMAMVLASSDALLAWRTISKPILSPFVPTSLAIMFAPYRPDDFASAQSRKLLSGLPLSFKLSTSNPYAKLYEAMQHMRTLVVRFNQWQRRCGDRSGLRPDLRQIQLTRMLIIHDLLSLDALDIGDYGNNNDGEGGPAMNLTYELSRHASLAFMQLVLFPITYNNDMPNKILKLTVPLLAEASMRLRDADDNGKIEMHNTGAASLGNTTNADLRADLETINTGLYFWVWMLAGMLALEHLQTKGESDWMDRLAPFVEDMPIKADKQTFPLVKGVMETFVWLSSECDSSGREWWNYACLWLQARQTDEENGADTPARSQSRKQRHRPKWALDAERIHAAVAEIPVVEID